MLSDEMYPLEYFAAGVPPGSIFKMNLDSLRLVVEHSRDGTVDGQTVLEVCYMGLHSYFEAFCKDHFACLINICPSLVKQLKPRGYELTVDVTELLSFGNISVHRLGFLIADKYDFGTAKQINAHYNALLLVTPFSGDAKAMFDRLLSDRNLLVHHGGVYNVRYIHQKNPTSPERQEPFWDSLVLTNEMYESAALFMENIALKIVRATKKALVAFIEERAIQQTDANKRAVSMLDYWD